MGEKGVKIRTVTAPQFYQLCEAVKNNQEMLKTLRGYETIIARLEEVVGFPIPRSTLRSVCETVGIELNFFSRRPQGKVPSQMQNHVRAVVNATVRLYKKLGEEVPEGLAGAYEYYKDKPTSNGSPAETPTEPPQPKVLGPAKPPPPPILPHKLVDPKRIEVANRRS